MLKDSTFKERFCSRDRHTNLLVDHERLLFRIFNHSIKKYCSNKNIYVKSDFWL